MSSLILKIWVWFCNGTREINFMLDFKENGKAWWLVSVETSTQILLMTSNLHQALLKDQQSCLAILGNFTTIVQRLLKYRFKSHLTFSHENHLKILSEHMPYTSTQKTMVNQEVWNPQIRLIQALQIRGSNPAILWPMYPWHLWL